MGNIMTNEQLYFSLVTKFKKTVDVKERVSCRPAKLGIAKPGRKVVKADPSYHTKGFKR